MSYFQISAFLLCGVISLGLAGEPQISPKSCAKVALVIGKATRDSGAEIRLGETLVEGSRVKTTASSYVKLLFKDDSVVDVSPQSVFVLKECTAPSVTGINLEMELGRIRANVNPEPSKPRKQFQIKTPTSVLAVRGTEFFVAWEKESSGLVTERISVSEGKVEVKSLFSQSAGPTLLSSGTEFRAQGLFQMKDQKPIVEVQEPPKVDQFNSREQKQLENEQKVEFKTFKEATELRNPGRRAERNENPQPKSFLTPVLSGVASFIQSAPERNGQQGQQGRQGPSQNQGNNSGTRNPASQGGNRQSGGAETSGGSDGWNTGGQGGDQRSGVATGVVRELGSALERVVGGGDGNSGSSNGPGPYKSGILGNIPPGLGGGPANPQVFLTPVNVFMSLSKQ